jgi:hypothetical protein
MDISRFDFELDEIVGLIPRLSGLVQIIELEPRLHNADEDKEVHSLRSEPTFRICCHLAGDDQTVSRLAALEVDAGLEAVLDFGRSVRFRHLRQNEISQPAPWSHRPSPSEEGGALVSEEDRPILSEEASQSVREESHPATSEEDRW